jgi:Mg/Co/Ni transporter MgtE
MRVSVQLLETAQNSTRWAKAFDANIGDVIDLEDTLSGQVAASLLSQLTQEERMRLEKRGTSNPRSISSLLARALLLEPLY